MPTTLNSGLQLPDKGSVDWYSSMQTNYNLLDNHLENTNIHVTAEDKANWDSKQGSLSQAQLDAIAQVATNTSDITALQSGKANASHTHSSSDITDIGDYATKQYVDNSISGLVDSAPNALDTLNELAAALNDDANFASTVATALSAKADSADLATVATSGDYNDLDNLPTIPTKTSDLSNDSDFVVSSNLATIATSGDYDDLSNKPSIPTNTSDLNNDSGFVTLNDFDIPAKTSDLTNDSGFITSSDVPTSTSDLINDSNFVDTSNSAVASGITSTKVTDYDTHIADTDIHVTTADKNRWNNQTYVFRYSSSSVTDNSTIAYSTLDNTDNIKSGDKIIDVDGKIFSVVSVDTTNQTVTVGSALVDLALDANVVHTNGVETVGGFKQFANIRVTNSIKGINLDSTTTDLNNCYSDFAPYGESKGGNIQYYYCNTDAGTANISNLPEAKAFFLISITTRLISNSLYVKQTLINSTNKTYTRYCNNGTWGSWVNETDSEYVHKSGNETVGGTKTFTNNTMVVGRDTDGTSVVQFVNSDVVGDSSVSGKSGFEVYGTSVSDANKIGSVILGEYSNNSGSYALITCNRTVSGVKSSNEIRNLIRSDGSKELTATVDNDCKLGNAFLRWSKIYGTEYYYGSNNIEFSTKFVTTDTAQTISGNKTFSSNVNVYNSDSTGNVSNIVLKNSKAEVGTEFAEQSINFVDKNNNPLATISCYGSSGNYTRLYITASDSNNNSDGIVIRKSLTGTTILPTTAGSVALGNPSAHFYNVQTSRVNGLTPSSLSMPVAPSSTSYVDISTYITVLDSSSANTYTPPSNGYITFSVTGNLVQIFHDYGLQGKWTTQAGNANRGFFPVLGGVEVKIYITASNIDKFWFIPCQGNV